MKKLLFALLLFINTSSYSQDLLCGEISHSHLTGNTYQINYTIYAQASTGIPPTYFLVNFGDGTADTIYVSAPIDSAGSLIYHLSSTHTYPGEGLYFIDLGIEFLVDSITNLPNSGHQLLFLEDKLIIDPFIGYDDSPVFTEPPIDSGQQDFPFLYNPGAYDSDGDSLSYSLVAVDSGYSFAGVSIDSVTGDITIINPPSGRYLFEIKVSQWRLIDSIREEFGNVENAILLSFTETMGVKEIYSQASINIFPNPATTQLTIHTPSFHNEAVMVSVLNVLGQEASPPAPLQGERGDAMIDVSKLSAGIYFLQMKSESGSVVKMFVKE